MMWTVFSLLLVSSLFVLKILHGTWTKDHDGGGKKPDSPNCYRGRCSKNLHEGEALQCYTCVGSSDDDCNRQGTQQCPGHSDACAVFRGQASGVMKSCSFRSFCERARRDGSRAPGVSVHCCYSNNCNAKSLGSRVTISTSYIPLLIFTLLWHPLLKVT